MKCFIYNLVLEICSQSVGLIYYGQKIPQRSVCSKSGIESRAKSEREIGIGKQMNVSCYDKCMSYFFSEWANVS
jgi:hypothetical protein